MADIKAKKVIFKNRDGEHLIPYVGDTAIENRISNCVLEVPQRIKLELNNGTITLKAGSVVTVPNGFEADGTTRKFDYITIESDISYTYLGDSLTAKLFWNAKTNKVYGEYRTYSGTTESPTESYVTKYDVTLNKIFRSTDGITWSDEYHPSLPIAIATTQKDFGFTSIDQVFNGFGYIGSTVWIDKGVKGLIPNGRNEDGTLNNIEAQNNKLVTITYTTDIKGVHFGFSRYGDAELNGEYSYDEKDNYVYNGKNTAPVMFCGTYDVVGGKITNFQPKLPFRAMDCIETYVNGTSWCRVWSNGWCEQGGQIVVNSANVGGGNYSTATLTFMKPFSKLMSWHCQARHDRFNTGFNTNVGGFVTSLEVYQVNDSGATFSNPFVLWQASGYTI